MIGMIFTILMMVVFFKVLGFMLRIGWRIAAGILGFVGFIIVAGLVLGFIGSFLLPMIIIGGLIGVGIHALRKVE